MLDTMTSQELADHWGVSSASIRMAAYRGDIPGCAQADNGHYVFDREVVLRDWVPPRVASWERKLSKPSLTGVGLAKEEAERRLSALREAVPPGDWLAIIRKAVAQAVTGDWRARQWLSNYLMGPPVQRISAEVDVTSQQKFDAETRAAAVMVLLQSVREREEAQVVDVTPQEIGSAATGTTEAPDTN